MRKTTLKALLIATVLFAAVPQARAAGDWTAGNKVQVEWKGKWFPSVIVKAEGAKVRVHYDGYEKAEDSWVDADACRFSDANKSQSVDPGAKVDAKWEGEWYPCTILETKASRYLVHYDGYDKTEDAWVTIAQVRAAE